MDACHDNTLLWTADVYIPPVSQPLNFLNNPNQSGLGSQLSPGQGSALMRSKSGKVIYKQN